jgi:hypothetical protein
MRHAAMLAAVTGALTLAPFAKANLVTNGSFESTTSGPGQMGFNTNATGWTTNGYNFIFASGGADTTGSQGQFGNLKLWGPGDGSNNGLPASSPDGGNYVGADGAFEVGAISQTINGLTVGQSYTVSFYWGAAQQFGFSGPTTEQWQVSLGGQTKTTPVINASNHGFTGWLQQSFTFTADNTSDVLSFLAIGTPSGVPPFALLDGVSMVAAPEPASLPLLATMVVGFAVVVVRRRRAPANVKA